MPSPLPPSSMVHGKVFMMGNNQHKMINRTGCLQFAGHTDQLTSGPPVQASTY